MNEATTKPDPDVDPARSVSTGAERAAGRPDGQSPSECAGAERARAAAYLDLWEKHVGDAAARGRGISAPWFGR